MKKIILTLIACAGLQTATAALPPLTQSIREITAILEDKQLAEHLTYSSPVVQIQKTESGYLISTLKAQIHVDVVEKEVQRIGPIEFDLHFNPPMPYDMSRGPQTRPYVGSR